MDVVDDISKTLAWWMSVCMSVLMSGSSTAVSWGVMSACVEECGAGRLASGSSPSRDDLEPGLKVCPYDAPAVSRAIERESIEGCQEHTVVIAEPNSMADSIGQVWDVLWERPLGGVTGIMIVEVDGSDSKSRITLHGEPRHAMVEPEGDGGGGALFRR